MAPLAEELPADGIVLRPFRPGTADDEGAKALEARASQHAHNVLLKTLVKVHVKHLAAFDSKARRYDDSVVLLAVDRRTASAATTGSGGPVAGMTASGDDGFVCGCICLGIKQAWLGGQVRRLGYVFDLRVHEDYQRGQIGTRLNEAVEQEAKRRGVNALYLTVNTTNARARRFYEKHGYCIGSKRALLFRPLLFAGSVGGRGDSACPSSSVPGAIFKRVLAAEAAKVADSSYGFSETASPIANAHGRDLALAGGFRTLLEACPENFVDSWVAEVRGGDDARAASFAALTLWDGDGTSTFEIERLLLPPGAWRRLSVQMLLVTPACVGLACWARALCLAPHGLGAMLSGAALLGVTGLGVVCAMLARFLLSRRRERARLIAPVASGPRGVELLMSLVRHAEASAKQLGFAVSIANLDVMDPVLPAFQSSRPSPRAIFMQKWLTGDTLHGMPFSPDAFFDPRDLS